MQHWDGPLSNHLVCLWNVVVERWVPWCITLHYSMLMKCKGRHRWVPQWVTLFIWCWWSHSGLFCAFASLFHVWVASKDFPWVSVVEHCRDCWGCGFMLLDDNSQDEKFFFRSEYLNCSLYQWEPYHVRTFSCAIGLGWNQDMYLKWKCPWVQI